MTPVCPPPAIYRRLATASPGMGAGSQSSPSRTQTPGPAGRMKLRALSLSAKVSSSWGRQLPSSGQCSRYRCPSKKMRGRLQQGHRGVYHRPQGPSVWSKLGGDARQQSAGDIGGGEECQPPAQHLGQLLQLHHVHRPVQPGHPGPHAAGAGHCQHRHIAASHLDQLVVGDADILGPGGGYHHRAAQQVCQRLCRAVGQLVGVHGPGPGGGHGISR